MIQDDIMDSTLPTKPPTGKLIADLHDAIGEMQDDILTICDYARVLQHLTADNEIQKEYFGGIYRLVIETICRADSLAKRQEETLQMVDQLAST